MKAPPISPSDQEILEEFVEAYYLSKTGQSPTNKELAELVQEIDEEAREKVLKIHFESMQEKSKSITNKRLLSHIDKQGESSYNQAWLILTGGVIGLFSAYVGQMKRKERAELFTIDRTQQESDFQKATMYVLVLVGFLLAIQRYWNLTVKPLQPKTMIERKMFLCLVLNLLFLGRFWWMIDSVRRLVPWWEAMVTGAGMTVLQPLFMGLCAMPINNQAGKSSHRGGVSGKKERSKDAVLFVDGCCVLLSVVGILLSTWSE